MVLQRGLFSIYQVHATAQATERREDTATKPTREDDMAMALTREQLLIDLYAAWHMARRHKVTKHYVRVFDRHTDRNLQAICDALFTRDYHYIAAKPTCMR
jgi:hypothetical protein